ncbi:MAG: site-specific integrase [Victivallales bacterium]|jgi:integrase/recombinase XerD|nr:site-specific integrase [Victivallales bacterium]
MDTPHSQHPVAQYVRPFFREHLTAERGLSSNTVAAYRDAMKLLLAFAADRSRVPPEELTVEGLDEHTILAFLDHIETARACSVATRNARLAAIRAFFRFLAGQEPLLLEQCRRVRTIPRKRAAVRSLDYLDEAEMAALLAAVVPGHRLAGRDEALLLFMYNTGARAQEVADLEIGDLRLDRPGHVRLHGKGRKERACPLWPETVQALERHIAQRWPKHRNDPHLFLNANGEPITRFGIRHIVRKYAAKAAEACPSITAKQVTAHTMGHSTAMHLIHSGSDINSVRLWLGHADLNTTHIYVEIDLEMKRKILQRCSPPPATNRRRTPAWLQPGILAWLENLTGTAPLCAAST